MTEADVLGWWNAGVKTVADLRVTGNAAIAAHHAGAPERRRQAAAMQEMAQVPWAAQVWRRDPRFRDLLPRSDVAVREICLNGSSEEQRQLWGSLHELEARTQRFASLPFAEAVAGYVEALSGQHGIRLDMLLARTGLSGLEPIMGREAAEALGVSYQRVQQIVGQLRRNRDRARPPTGIWLPQVDAAVDEGWPDGYTAMGVEATRLFFGR